MSNALHHLSHIAGMEDGGCSAADVARYINSIPYGEGGIACSHSIEDRAEPGSFAEQVFAYLCGDAELPAITRASWKAAHRAARTMARERLQADKRRDACQGGLVRFSDAQGRLWTLHTARNRWGWNDAKPGRVDVRTSLLRERPAGAVWADAMMRAGMDRLDAFKMRGHRDLSAYRRRAARAFLQEAAAARLGLPY